MENNFYSMVLRMKHVNRWGLMRNTWKESLSEHTLDVVIISQALAVISKKRLGNDIDVSRVTMLALFHDASEIITGDLPTTIKYFNQEIKTAYKNIEQEASKKLLNMLPEDFKDEYEDAFIPKESDEYLWRLVKGADRISALIKCIEEEDAGNHEFILAKKAQFESIKQMQMKEIDIFLEEFLAGFSKPLEELND